MAKGDNRIIGLPSAHRTSRAAGLDQLGPSSYRGRTHVDWVFKGKSGKGGPRGINGRAALSSKKRKVKVSLPTLNIPDASDE